MALKGGFIALHAAAAIIWRNEAISIEFKRCEGATTEKIRTAKPDMGHLAVEWQVARDPAEILRAQQPKVAGFLEANVKGSRCLGESTENLVAPTL